MDGDNDVGGGRSSGANGGYTPTAPPLLVVTLAGSAASRFADFVSLTQDLNFVLQCLKRLLDDLGSGGEVGDAVSAQAYFSAAQLAYARCFDGGRRLDLDPGVMYAHLLGEPLAFHQQQIDMRNKRLAHSVNAFERVGIGALLPPVQTPDAKVVGVAALSMSHISYDREGLLMFGELTKVALEYVVERTKEAQADALEFAQGLSVDELYRSPTLRMYGPGPEEAGRARP